MKVLALELSTALGSLAWLIAEDRALVAAGSAREESHSDVNRPPISQTDDGEHAGEWPNDRKNSGAFFEHLAGFRRKFGLPDTIIVGLGPGSYAGTRTAISTAIGLQAASKARLIGFPSICAMDCDSNEYCVIGDARRQSFFFAYIRANTFVELPTLFAETALKMRLDRVDENVPIFASEELPQFEKARLAYPSARVLARLARNSDRNFVLPPLEPIYLREPYLTVPKGSTTI
jgi:tRNA threonylcarbamoyladenosine biosynthesis protein TsaB